MIVVCTMVRIGIVVVVVVIIVLVSMHRREHPRLLLSAFSFPAKREPNSPFALSATSAVQLLLLVRLQRSNRLRGHVSAASAATRVGVHLRASSAERRRMLRRR